MVVTFLLSILILAFIIQLIGPKVGLDMKRVIQILSCISVGLIFAYFVYLIVFQYILWRDAGPPSIYFIPPYQSIWYVVNYHFIRFGLYYLISLVAAAVFFIAAQKLNNRFNERFFEPEEPYLGALSIFLLGNPAWGYAWIFYIVAMLSIAAIATSYQLLVTKENHRFSLYWLWLPVAILTIIVMSLF